jgi:hypothetical protein
MEKNLVTLVAWHFIIVYVLLIFDTARHAGKITTCNHIYKL